MTTVSRYLVLPCLLLAGTLLTAQDIDENALFGDTALTIIDSATLAASAIDLAGTDSTSVSFSGSMDAITEPSFSRNWFSNLDREEIALSSLMLGSLMLDVRLPLGIKTFVNAETWYNPAQDGATFTIPELFLDVNYNRQIYFRAGKQVLQWGRGYFWNPTDLVNVEKKTFVKRIGAREGTYGLKTHIPFGTKWNIYSFLDMNNTSSIDSLAGAARFEGLFGGTEAGIAFWGKRGKDPIFGLDFSTTILSWSVTGEMSLTSGKNYHILDLPKTFSQPPPAPGATNSLLFSSPDEDLVVRACAGVMRTFDFMDVDDRIMVVGEVYFNQIGDKKNVIDKYNLSEHIKVLQQLPDSMQQQASSMVAQSFEFNSLARWYSAFFVTMSKFIVSDLTLQLNGLVNYNHHCALLTTGVTYATLHNFTLSALLTGYMGSENSEYTFMGNGASLRLTAGVTF